jgi:hypothetical protein
MLDVSKILIKPSKISHLLSQDEPQHSYPKLWLLNKVMSGEWLEQF